MSPVCRTTGCRQVVGPATGMARDQSRAPVCVNHSSAVTRVAGPCARFFKWFTSEVRSLLVLSIRLVRALGVLGAVTGPSGGSSVLCVGPRSRAYARTLRTWLAIAGVTLAAVCAVLLALTGDADAAVGAPHDIIAFPPRDYAA